VESPEIQKLARSWTTDRPIEWVRVHDLPDYVYFNHSAHVARGVGCVSCHGRVDQMERVTQVQDLSMGWCLDCHRAPEQHLRPDWAITDLDYAPTEPQEVVGRRLLEANNIRNLTDCSTCHR